MRKGKKKQLRGGRKQAKRREENIFLAIVIIMNDPDPDAPVDLMTEREVQQQQFNTFNSLLQTIVDLETKKFIKLQEKLKEAHAKSHAEALKYEGLCKEHTATLSTKINLLNEQLSVLDQSEDKEAVDIDAHQVWKINQKNLVAYTN